MCERVDNRVSCNECGYPYSEALAHQDDFPELTHSWNIKDDDYPDPFEEVKGG